MTAMLYVDPHTEAGRNFWITLTTSTILALVSSMARTAIHLHLVLRIRTQHFAGQADSHATNPLNEEAGWFP